MKNKIVLLVRGTIMAGSLSLAWGGPLHGQNLLTNGDFEQGNQGFNTDYPNYYASENSYTAEGSYTVGNNPKEDSVEGDGWAEIGDHTTGTGNMLMVDANNFGTRIWYETVTVSPDTLYLFSYWATSINTTFNTEAAQLQLTVNGTPSPPDILEYASTGETDTTWVNYTETWYSGTQTTATVALSDNNTSHPYNDLAIDDLSLRAVPEPSRGALFAPGGALFVAIFLFRSRSRASRA